MCNVDCMSGAVKLVSLLFVFASYPAASGAEKELPIGVPNTCDSLLTANQAFLTRVGPTFDSINPGDWIYFELLDRGMGGVIPDAQVVQFASFNKDHYSYIESVNGVRYKIMNINENSLINMSSHVGNLIYFTIAEEFKLSTRPAGAIGGFLFYKLQLEGFEEKGILVDDEGAQKTVPWRFIFLPALSGRVFQWPLVNQGYPFGGIL
jgi:hypothetical protein